MFSFNNRKDLDDKGRFDLTVSQLVGGGLPSPNFTASGSRYDSLAWTGSAERRRSLSPLFLRSLALPLFISAFCISSYDTDNSLRTTRRICLPSELECSISIALRLP